MLKPFPIRCVCGRCSCRLSTSQAPQDVGGRVVFQSASSIGALDPATQVRVPMLRGADTSTCVNEECR